MPDTFFERGTGPLASILIPTRHRPRMLCEAIDSVYSLAHNKSHVEFILKIDEDDTDTLAVYDRLSNIVPCKAIISPRGNGYADMHHWVNQMSEWAIGDWLYLFNDDARMTAQDWDMTLLTSSISEAATWHGCPAVCQLLTPTIDRPDAYEFGFVRRSVFEIMGHYSLNVHNDTYITCILCFLSSAFRIPVMIKHMSNEIDDEVRRGALAEYDKSGRELNSIQGMRNKINDIEKLMRHIEAWQHERKLELEDK